MMGRRAAAADSGREQQRPRAAAADSSSSDSDNEDVPRGCWALGAGRGTLVGAAWHGQLAVVQRLLGQRPPPDVNGCTESTDMQWAASPANGGWTGLLAAAHNGHAAVVNALLKAGADRTARTAGGWDALGLALRGGHAPAAALLYNPLDPAEIAAAAQRLAFATLLRGASAGGGGGGGGGGQAGHQAAVLHALMNADLAAEIGERLRSRQRQRRQQQRGREVAGRGASRKERRARVAAKNAAAAAAAVAAGPDFMVYPVVHHHVSFGGRLGEPGGEEEVAPKPSWPVCPAPLLLCLPLPTPRQEQQRSLFQLLPLPLHRVASPLLTPSLHFLGSTPRRMHAVQ